MSSASSPVTIVVSTTEKEAQRGKIIGNIVGSVILGAMVYAVCGWLISLEQQTSLYIGLAVGGFAFLIGIVRIGREMCTKAPLAR